MITHIKGQGIKYLWPGEEGIIIDYDSTATASECCVKCLLNNRCGAASWVKTACVGYGIPPGRTCNPRAQWVSFGLGGPETEFTLINTNCGRWGPGS